MLSPLVLFIGPNHFFGRGFRVFRKLHRHKPVIVIATLQQNRVGCDLVAVLTQVVSLVTRRRRREGDRRGRSERPRMDDDGGGGGD
ncbi:hypothetical protein WN943_006273 [Citrus x changshan-huyou]